MRGYSVAVAPVLARPVALTEIDTDDADTLPLDSAHGYSVAVAQVLVPLEVDTDDAKQAAPAAARVCSPMRKRPPWGARSARWGR